MSIDFHARDNRLSYASREVMSDWSDAMRALVDATGRRVVDIGCGGGLYATAWARLGAANVIGIDFSEQMVGAARERAAQAPNLSFRIGNALASGLSDGCADIVFERALIHHIDDLTACCAEAFRLLSPGGRYIIQDRTPDDVALPGSPEHIRGYFFERVPRLLEIERARRPTANTVTDALNKVGFADVRVRTIWETRRRYAAFADLAADLRGRTGRSILHDLNDTELDDLIGYIRDRLPPDRPIAERDRWSLWSARRPG